MAAVAAAPAAPAAGKRKRDFAEDDVYLILHKYTPATILTVLQEVARHAGRRRIDWRALVARTATGITSAHEYQGDESDLECEIEPFPTPRSKAAAEASGFAEILIYGSSREQASSHRVKSEVPVLNIPNEKISRVPSDKQLGQNHRLTNGTGPVSNSKQASHTGLSPDPFDGNGPPKKKRKPKPWSKEEDANLTAGVRKCGEGNWLDILHKYSFDNTRSAVQLSQRWTLVCKRQGTIKIANAKPVSAYHDIKATQNAVYMALDMSMGKPGLSTLRRSGPSQHSIQHHAPVFATATPELKSAAPSSSFPLPVAVSVPVPLQVQMPLPQLQQAPAQAAPLRMSITSNKSRNNSKKQAAQTNAPSSIQAAAIAAGGRIATQSVATKFLKAAQSTRAVHVKSRGTGSLRTSASSKSSTMASESGTQLCSAQHPELPNRSAPTSSPPVLTTWSTEQVNVVPEAERRMSTTPACDNVKMDDDSTFCVVTMEDLFPEDVKQSDIVDPKSEEIMDHNDADSMLEFDRFVESQKKLPKQLPAVESFSVSARDPAMAVKKTKTLGSHGASFLLAVTSSGLVGTGNAGVLTKALGGQPSGHGTTGKQNRCQENMAQKQHATNSESNGMAKNPALGAGAPARNMAPSAGAPGMNVALSTGTSGTNAVPGAGTPARNMTAPGTGAPGRNAALGTGTLAKNTAPVIRPVAKNVAPSTRPTANRRYNPVVSGASKGNPPASK